MKSTIKNYIVAALLLGLSQKVFCQGPAVSYAAQPVYPAWLIATPQTPVNKGTAAVTASHINPTETQNFISVYTPRVAGLKTSTALNAASADKTQVAANITYFDALGRPSQSVQVRASATGRDVVTPFAYDQFGREANKYLPYSAVASASDGSYKSTAITDQASFYNNPSGTTWNAPGVVEIDPVGGVTPSFSQTGFEPSPLDRVVEQGFAGSAWQVSGSGDANSSGHTVRAVYTQNDQTTAFNTHLLTNNPGGKIVALYTTAINYSTQTQRLVRTGNAVYGAGQLVETITRDENWQPGNGCLNSTEEYTDKLGHVVLKRTYNASADTIQMLSTYYVYDILGNLAFVLPPGATPDNAGLPTQALLDNFCYQYNYDNRNRVAAKKIPGKGWEYAIYNKLDQVIAEQDSVQRMKVPQQVFYNKYDALGRMIISGFYNTTDSVAGVNNRAALQNTGNAQTTLWETKSTSGIYSVTTIPTSGGNPLVINYYDDYNISGLPAGYALTTGISNMTKGLTTVTQTTIVNNNTDKLWAAHYYDDLGRVTTSYNQHYFGGHSGYGTGNYDLVANIYNFSNQLTTSTRQHFNSRATTAKVAIADSYSYDHIGRKTHSYEQITGKDGLAQTSVTVSSTTYNELGQPRTNSFHEPAGGTSYLYETVYAYNERGWLTSLLPVGNSYYGENIYYNSPTGAATPQYNGNISQFSYNGYYMNQKNSLPLTNFNTVNYTYDNLNRLTQSQSTIGKNDEALTYDVMGNITSLVRSGTSWLSGTLTYAYNTTSNQLHTVKINGGSTNYKTYSYNGDGSATSDSTNRTLTYNLYNMPLTLTKSGTTLATYYYDGNSNKLRDVSAAFGTRDYVNGIVYVNGQISFIQTEEGRVTLGSDSITYSYSYDIKDYLGNVRASYDNSGTGGAFAIKQENDYYPFGLSQPYYDVNGNHYLYNGKEQQFDLANQYDYGARFYDPVIGRWNTIDPFSEKDRRWSTYNYVLDNPIRFEDPDGMEWKDPAKDQAIADRLQNQIMDRLSDEGTAYDKTSKQIDKIKGEISSTGGSEKLTNALNKATKELSEISSNISNLEQSSNDLNLMGSKDVHQQFDFNEISGSQGETYKDNGVITMDVVGDASAIHETTHGVQGYHGEITLGAKGSNTHYANVDAMYSSEVQAYSRQFSFDNSSVKNLSSYAGSVSSLSDIKPSWVLGLRNASGTFIYGDNISPGALPKAIKEVVNTMKKAGE